MYTVLNLKIELLGFHEIDSFFKKNLWKVVKRTIYAKIESLLTFVNQWKTLVFIIFPKFLVQKSEHKENITAGLFWGNYEDLQQQVNGFHSWMVNQSHPSYLDFPPRRCSWIPHIICHLVPHEALDMLRLDPIRMLAVDRLPRLVVEPGSPHYLQTCTWPVNGITLPFVEIDFVNTTSNNNVKISIVFD